MMVLTVRVQMVVLRMMRGYLLMQYYIIVCQMHHVQSREAHCDKQNTSEAGFQAS